VILVITFRYFPKYYEWTSLYIGDDVCYLWGRKVKLSGSVDNSGSSGCQQNIAEMERGRTFRLFVDEQPLEGSNVTCLESREISPWLQPTHQRFHNDNATTVDRCIGSNNSSIVTLTEYPRLQQKVRWVATPADMWEGNRLANSLTLAAEENSLTLAAEGRSLTLNPEERSLQKAAAYSSWVLAEI
jgi:hypothetical protein